MSLTLIEKKLSQLRGHIRLMFLSWGLAKVTIWAAGLTLFLYYTDRFLKLPGGMRIGFLAIAIFVLLVVVIRSLVYPLSRTLDDEDLALLVEREYPLLNDRLISSLQILKNQERYKDAASEDMMRAVVGESFDIAGRLQFNEAVRSRKLLYIVIGSLCAMLLLFGHAWFDRDNMSIWVKRALGQGSAWPTATQLDVQILSADQVAQYPTEKELTVNFTFNPEGEIPELGVTGVYEVAANSDLRIIARPSGEIPDDAEIVITSFQRDPDSGEYVRVGNPIERPMVRSAVMGSEEEELTIFSYNKMSIINPLEQVMIKAGDATAGPYTLRVIPAPELDDPLELTFMYPTYLMLQDNTTQDLPIDAVAGTKVEFRFSTTKPLLLEGPDASRLLVDFNVGSTEQIPINTDLEAGDNHYIATIPGLRKGMARYRLNLVDRQGIENTRAIGDVMKVKEDAPPTVRVLFSGDPLVSNQLVYVTNDAELPIEFELTDDYGIGSVKLFWRLKIESEYTEYAPFAEQFKDLADDPQQALTTSFTLQFAELLKDKVLIDVGRPAIQLYIQAYDLNSEKVEVDGESRITFQGSRHPTHLTYEIYELEELRVKVSGRIRQAKTSINTMLENQIELMRATDDALNKPDLLDFRGEEGERLRNDLNESYKGQNQMLRDAEVVLREFGVFAQVYRYNRLEREDLDRPQESRIQAVRLLLAIMASERDLQQNINTPLVRLQEAEGEDVAPLAEDVIAGLNDELKRALPGAGFSNDAFGKLLQETEVFSPGCLERARGMYESLLEVGIKPNERRELLVELRNQQDLAIEMLEAIQEQVKKWEGFDDILHGFRNLLDTQKETNEKIKEEAE